VSGSIRNQWAPSLTFAAGAAAILIYFVSFAGQGLSVGYGYDDLMNMDRALGNGSLGQYFVRCFFFFLHAMRPLGDGFYVFTYQMAGFDTRLLRDLSFALALCNVGVLCGMVTRISSSYEIGLFAALIGAIHGNLSSLYFNSGMCYDLLAFPLYCLALWLYVAVRQRGLVPGSGWTAAVLLFFVLSLAAKEIALSFPFVLLAYELIWHPPASLQAAGRWIFREGRTVWLSAIIAGIFVAVRVYGAQGLAVTQSGSYRTAYSAAGYLNVLTVSTNDLFYRVDTFTPWRTAVFWLALIAVAALLRSRLLLFCVSFTLLAMLPLGFVPPRGLGASYLPMAGVWAYLAALVVAFRRFVAAKFIRSDVVDLLSRIALFAGLLFFLVRIDRMNFAVDSGWLVDEATHIRTVSQTLKDLHLNMPQGAHVLLVNDAFEPRFAYVTLFILRLMQHDHSLEVERCTDSPDFAASHYDAVLTYRDARFEQLTGCNCRSCCR